jgi:hypothetical protein
MTCRAEGAEHDDRGAGFLTRNPRYGVAVHAGKHQVQHNQRRFDLPHQAQSGQAVGGDSDFEPGPFQV